MAANLEESVEAAITLVATISASVPAKGDFEMKVRFLRGRWVPELSRLECRVQRSNWPTGSQSLEVLGVAGSGMSKMCR